MKINNFILYIAAFSIILLVHNTFATELIYGKVISASTCMPIAGAQVYSAYNNNATNVSIANGTYSLALGIGNWTIYAKANGYYSESYNTPYVYEIELNHNFALLPFGGTMGSCLQGLESNTTIPSIVPKNTTNHTIPPIPHPSINNTTAPNTTAPVQPQSNTGLYIIAVIILIIIILLVFLKKRKKAPPVEEEHFVHPQELIKK